MVRMARPIMEVVWVAKGPIWVVQVARVASRVVQVARVALPVVWVARASTGLVGELKVPIMVGRVCMRPIGSGRCLFTWGGQCPWSGLETAPRFATRDPGEIMTVLQGTDLDATTQ